MNPYLTQQKTTSHQADMPVVISKAIKALRSKQDRTNDPKLKVNVECSMNDILGDHTLHQKNSLKYYHQQGFKNQVSLFLRNHSKLRYDLDRDLFHFKKR